MNKKIKILLMMGFAAVGTVVAILFGSREEVLPIGSTLPALKYVSQKESGDIPVKNRPLMIMYFKPDCSHCEYEFDTMNKRFNELKGIDIFCLTTDKEFIRGGGFKKWNNLLNAGNFVFAFVDGQEYKNKIGIDITPLFLFVNGKGKIVDKIIGETKFDRLLESIKKAGGAQHR